MDKHLSDCILKYLTTLVTMEDVRKFIKLPNYEKRFIYGLEIVLRGSKTLFDFECKQKSADYSTKLRQDGNHSFQRHKCYKAVQEYTESLMHAPNLSEEQALAYANRSAALFEIEKYSHCLQDIDKALNLQYPDKLKTKLYKRKGICLMKVGKPDAHLAFEAALYWLEKQTLSADDKNKSRMELTNLKLTSYAIVKSQETESQLLNIEIQRPNKKILCASDAITITHSKKYGRQLVATRPIQPGELIIAEKPYCRRLLHKHVYSHCSYCLQAAWTMIPCEYCVNVAYCSETCKSQAWHEYHEIECPVLGMLLNLKIGDSISLSLRMAIVATQKGVRLDALKQEVIDIEQNTDPCASLYSSDGKFHSDQYRCIHCSEENAVVDEISGQKLLSKSLWVSVTVYALATQSEMFGKKLEPAALATNPDVAFIGGLMLKHVQVAAAIKTHRVTIQHGRHQNEYGHSLMGLCSLLNHSCDPNTIKRWQVDRMVRYASYPISKGEQIFDNYESNFTMMTKSKRQECFKFWNFMCDCPACVEDWPLLNDIPSYKEQRLSRQSRKKLDETVEKFPIYNSLLLKNTQRSPELLQELVKLIELLYRIVRKPCKELTIVIMLLKLFFATDESIWEFETVSESDTESQPSTSSHP